jgi:hypothetical protein
MSVKELATVSKIKEKTLRSRLARKWSAEKAIGTPTKVLFGYQGKKMTTKDLLTYSKVGRKTINYRLKKGWSVEKAVETPPYKTCRKPKLQKLNKTKTI